MPSLRALPAFAAADDGLHEIAMDAHRCLRHHPVTSRSDSLRPRR